jgi:hypothetical protein
MERPGMIRIFLAALVGSVFGMAAGLWLADSRALRGHLFGDVW